MFCPKCGNHVDTNENFCNKCGNKLNNNFEHQTNVNINNNSNKKGIILGLGIGGSIVFIIVLVYFIFFNKNDYYFSSDSYNENNEINNQENNTTETTKRKSKYSTVIITDNTYSGVSINNAKDAYDLISKDSVNQKNNCSSEIKKIEETIINKYDITAVNLCELDLNYAKELVNVIDKIYSEYPNAKSYLTNLTLINASMSEGYIAAFMPVFNFATSDSKSGYPWVIKTQILLNTSYFLNEERLIASVNDGSSSGHFPKNATKYSPVAHEFGHYLSFLAMMKDYQLNSILLVDNNNVTSFYNVYSDFAKGNFSLKMIKEAYNNYKKDTNTKLTLDEWRATISKYALAKDNSGEYIYDETIAESFHDVYLNGDKASEASKYVIKVLKNKLGVDVK